jgi:hypothetical protein
VSIFAPHAVPLPLATKSSPASGPEAEAAGFTGAIGFHVDRAGISELGRVEHDPLEGFTPSIDRALVLGGRLFTVSREGLMVSDLATLARLGFAVFS